MGETTKDQQQLTNNTQIHWGLNLILLAKSSPKILLLLEHNNCLARMEASWRMQYIISEKHQNSINGL